jgi:hypothetical protein
MVMCNSMGPIPGLRFGFPDVCKTPPFAIPIPYPNVAISYTAIPTQLTTFFGLMPAYNFLTMEAVSFGDQPGVMGGVLSQIFMGPVNANMMSTCLFLAFLPATTMGHMTGHNGVIDNTIGGYMSPTQISTLCLR